MSIILTTFIVILMVLNSTLTGLSSTTLFRHDRSEVTQNNLMTAYVFASPDEEADNNNDHDGASEDNQGVSDEESDENNSGAGEDKILYLISS